MMKTTSNALNRFRHSVGIGATVIVCSFVFCANAQDHSERMRRFEADRQACLGRRTPQVFNSCMKEAKALLGEAPGANPSVGPDELKRNALIRCEALTADDRTACQARMRGEGTVTGSVAGGGK
jgi:hypothetical protein